MTDFHTELLVGYTPNKSPSEPADHEVVNERLDVAGIILEAIHDAFEREANGHEISHNVMLNLRRHGYEIVKVTP